MFAALAQLERDIIIERTKAGLESARRRGKVLGAPKGISKKNQQKAVLCEEYFRDGKLTVSELPDDLDRICTFLKSSNIRFCLVNDHGNHSIEDSKKYKELIEKYK